MSSEIEHYGLFKYKNKPHRKAVYPFLCGYQFTNIFRVIRFYSFCGNRLVPLSFHRIF